jgi:hypothetical protein
MNNLVTVQDMGVMADAIVRSNFYGFKTKDQVIAVMLVAQAENKHPATVMQEYDIIQGRPALKSQAILARFQMAGGKVQWVEVGPKRCIGTFTHESGGSITVEWTIDMAKQAGVFKEGSAWTKYPEDMLRARVISRAVRSIYPACILGHYSSEEVQDFEPARVERDITPPRQERAVEAVTVMQGNEPVSIPIEMMGEPLPTHPLYLPNIVEPYANYLSIDDWQAGYLELFRRLKNSKYSNEEKAEKYDMLKEANKEFIDSWDSVTLAKLLRGIHREIKGEE